MLSSSHCRKVFSEVAYNFFFSAVFSLDFFYETFVFVQKIEKKGTNVDVHKSETS